MVMKLTTTGETTSHIKCLIYGDSGAGKTWLCQTAPKPVIISAEKGLLTLKDVNIPVIEISSFADLKEAYEFITTSKHAEGFETICLDSISDIAETILGEEKETCGNDPRKAYGNYADKLLPLIKKFRDIQGKHVYFTAKLKRITDEFTGISSYGPSMPGQQLGPNLPYLFDFVLPLRIGVDEDNEKFRYLQTDADIQYTAKARGGSLDETEPPDLDYIFKKALSANPKQKNEKVDEIEEKKEEKVEKDEPGSVPGSVQEASTTAKKAKKTKKPKKISKPVVVENPENPEESLSGSEDTTDSSMEQAAKASMSK